MNTNEEVRGDRSLFHSRKRQPGERDRGDGIGGWNVLSSTRWQTKAAAPPELCVFGDCCHRLRRSRSTVLCGIARNPRATIAVEAAVSAAMGLDSAGDTPATTNESAYLFFRFAQYDDITNLITRHRVLLRAVRRHRQPIEVVIEEPIPAGKVG